MVEILHLSRTVHAIKFARLIVVVVDPINIHSNVGACQETMTGVTCEVGDAYLCGTRCCEGSRCFSFLLESHDSMVRYHVHTSVVPYCSLLYHCFACRGIVL